MAVKKKKAKVTKPKKKVAKKVVKKVTKVVTAKKSPTKKTQSTIYVQIASYRDPELLPTLIDMIRKAEFQDNLRIGVAWQHSPYDEWDTLGDYINDWRFKVIDIDYRDARGPCFARAKLNEKYEGETYILQLDSHHRFAEKWDTQLIEMLEGLRSKKHPQPLLSSYLPSFEPKDWPNGKQDIPWIMEFDRFAPEGPVHFLPHSIDDYKERTEPVPTRFISGHFIFADGSFVKDVPYDPNFYFHGEEIDLSIRAYMAGYDMFAPHKSVIWHEYYRNGKKKHWDDVPKWNEMDAHSHAHLRQLYGIDAESPAIGKKKRSLLDYEMYAGLEFKTRRVHQKTIEKVKPPVSLSLPQHINGLTDYNKICVDVFRGQLTEPDYNVWVVAFEDENGNEFYRQDANREELMHIMNTAIEDKFVHIWRSFYSKQRVAKWIVWPHSESKGWMERLSGNVGR